VDFYFSDRAAMACELLKLKLEHTTNELAKVCLLSHYLLLSLTNFSLSHN